ncbi:MAG: hypothetical protein P8N51_10530 [Pseudomonadales bacterium]|nr:hypothetical protein [Pseudomonadales bacterium]MDG1442861.1 hypothetical protein [Pseudomonadales bacterium]
MENEREERRSTCKDRRLPAPDRRNPDRVIPEKQARRQNNGRRTLDK